TFGRPGYLRRAMEAGASGFLVKDAPVEELAGAVRRGVGGGGGGGPAPAAAAPSAGPHPPPPPGRAALRAGPPRAPPPRPAPGPSPRARCATTAPRRSARPTPATGSRPCRPPVPTAGSDPGRRGPRRTTCWSGAAVEQAFQVGGDPVLVIAQRDLVGDREHL